MGSCNCEVCIYEMQFQSHAFHEGEIIGKRIQVRQGSTGVMQQKLPLTSICRAINSDLWVAAPSKAIKSSYCVYCCPHVKIGAFIWVPLLPPNFGKTPKFGCAEECVRYILKRTSQAMSAWRGPPEGEGVAHVTQNSRDLHHEVGLDMGIIFMYNLSIWGGSWGPGCCRRARFHRRRRRRRS